MAADFDTAGGMVKSSGGKVGNLDKVADLNKREQLIIGILTRISRDHKQRVLEQWTLSPARVSSDIE